MATIPETSTMLLAAIAKDSQSLRWHDFYNRYQPVMEGYLRTAFPTVEIEDVIQETMLALMEKLPDYRYDPDAHGHFRNYLIGVVKFKAIEQLKKREREAEKLKAFGKSLADDGMLAADRSSDDELREWRHHAYEVALAQLMADEKIQARSRQVFARVAVDHESPEAVAAAYGITRNGVDQIKNRLIGRLRELVRKLTEDDALGNL